MSFKLKWVKVKGFGLGQYGEQMYGEYRAHGMLGKWNIFVLARMEETWNLICLLPGIGDGEYDSELIAKTEANKKMHLWIKEAQTE